MISNKKNMLWKFLYWAAVIIITFIVAVAIRELIPYIKFLTRYKSQNIRYHYIPIIGWMGFYMGGKKDQLDYFRKLVNEEHKDEDIFAMNEQDTTSVVHILRSPELIKEFFVKEIDYTKKVVIGGVDGFDGGFFFKSGKRALQVRSIFNNFFKPENLQKITPSLRKIFDEKFEELKEKINSTKEKKLEKFELRTVYGEAFSKVVNEILFGEKEPKIKNGVTFVNKDGKQKIIEEGEMSLTSALENANNILFSVVELHPLNLICYGKLSGTGIIKEERTAMKVLDQIYKKLEEIIEKKEKLKDEDLGVSIIDIMIRYNRKTEKEEEKSEREEMIANIFTFQIAGMDTSRATSESLIQFVSMNQQCRNTLIGIIDENSKKDKNSYETYESNEKFNYFVDEVLRLFGPADNIFPRLVTKKMKLGKYVLNKGDKVMVPLHALHYSSKLFENEKSFNLERFDGSKGNKVIRNSYLPFSAGRRACIGKYFGLLMIKTNISVFFENFEILKGYESNLIMRFTYGTENCLVDLKVKDK